MISYLLPTNTQAVCRESSAWSQILEHATVVNGHSVSCGTPAVIFIPVTFEECATNILKKSALCRNSRLNKNCKRMVWNLIKFLG